MPPLDTSTDVRAWPPRTAQQHVDPLPRIGARDHTCVPDRPTEPPIHTILRRTLAAVTLSLLATLGIALSVAVNPGAAYANSSSTGQPVAYTHTATGGRIDVVVAFALAQRGKPYRWGAAGPNAYDCSGLLVRSFAQVGVRLPHQSEQMVRGKRVVARKNWTPGTALKYPGHIALYLGSGKMIHASRAGKPVAVVNVYGAPTGYRIV